MCLLAISIEFADDVAVELPQDADPASIVGPPRVATRIRASIVSSLFRCGMVGLGKLNDVVAGVLERDQLAAAGQFIGSSNSRDQPFSRISFVRSPIGADVRVSVAASLADEPRLDIGQPNVIRPLIRTDGCRMAALVIRAIDQDATSAGGPHLSKGDFRLAGDSGHRPDSADRAIMEAATDWACSAKAHKARGAPADAFRSAGQLRQPNLN